MTEHNETCDCGAHEYQSIKPATRWSFSVLFVVLVMFLMKPLFINRILSRAEAYSACGMYNNAIRQCTKVLAIDKSDSRAWNTMGSSYKSQGDIEQAVRTFLTAINIDSDNRVAHFKLGMIFALEQNYKRATPYFEQVREMGPETDAKLQADPFSYYKSALDMLATCYERLGKKEKAMAVIEQLKTECPEHIKAAGKTEQIKESQGSD